MSPRRSSRARTSQPSPLVATQTTSSSSSVASDRAQRATRSHNKLGSPQRSIPRSQSQDEPEEPAKPPPRRTRSGHNEIKEPTPSVDLNGDLDDEEAQEEDEITRCVCGQSEYPGLSTPLIDLLQKAGYVPPGDQAYEQLGDVFLCCDKCHVWQHAGCVGILGKINEPDSYYCDECRRDLHKVATSMEGQRYSRYVPVMDEPPYRRSPKPSTRNGKSKDRPRSNTDATQHKRRVTMNSRNMDEELARVIEESKRENGSNNGSLSAAAGATRNGKRGRDEDDEYVNAIMTSDSDSATRTTSHALAPTRAAAAADHFASRRKSITKRQRTESSSPPQEPKDEASEDDGGEAADDAAVAVAAAATATAATPATAAIEATEDVTPKKSIRGAAVRNSNQVKEAREQRERERQAAATARKVRSERRRGEDSDNEEPTIEQPPSTAASSPPPEPTPASVRTTMVSNKKKPTPARRGRMGRNQHTRERDSPGPELGEENTSSLLATNPHNTRARSRSRSLVRGEEPGSERKGGGVSTPNGSSGGVGATATTATVAVAAVGSTESKPGGGIIKANFTFDDGGLLAKPSKARNFNEKKTSLNEMKKRVAAILEFVQRAQAERPAEGSRGGGGGGGGGDGGSSSAGMSRSASMAGVPVMTNGAATTELKSGLPAVTVDAGAGIKSLADEADDGATREAFEHLSAAEMLVSLKTRLVAFEGNFGRWGDSR